MINNADKCWICEKPIGKSGSEHHLFNYYDFKDKMEETFEDTIFDKKTFKKKVRLKWMKIKDKIPSFKVHYNCHRELEKRLRRNRNKKLKET